MSFKTLEWTGGRLRLLDQRRLPTSEEYVDCETWQQVAGAIRDMVVRGAPAIGVTAAYGVALAARAGGGGGTVEAAIAGLGATRPTAVNLFWALNRMRARRASSTAGLAADLLDEARAIHREDVAMCAAMGRHGGPLLPEGARVLTHCNAGALATSGAGTALAVIREAWRIGRLSQVFADETRPFLQGARLTAWELARDEIPVWVITDNMAGHFMQRGEVDAVVVGADRIAANGDVANKIGTYTVAVLCARHQVPFYVTAPSSTIDLGTATGGDIPIEERPTVEVTHVGGRQLVPTGVPVRNPAFDVTPAELVTAIITERGVVRAPYLLGLAGYGRADAGLRRGC